MDAASTLIRLNEQQRAQIAIEQQKLEPQLLREQVETVIKFQGLLYGLVENKNTFNGVEVGVPKKITLEIDGIKYTVVLVNYEQNYTIAITPENSVEAQNTHGYFLPKDTGSTMLWRYRELQRTEKTEANGVTETGNICVWGYKAMFDSKNKTYTIESIRGEAGGKLDNEGVEKAFTCMEQDFNVIRAVYPTTP